MLYSHIMIRYGELTLKGKNRKDFIDCLFLNVKKACADIPHLEFEKQYDRMYITFLDESVIEDLLQRLKLISGISSYSLVAKMEKDIDIMKEKILLMLQQKKVEPSSTFKVIARRSDKNFPIVSDQINREIASEILKNTNLKVDVHQPNIKIKIEVRLDACYVYFDQIEGLKGFPLGMGGKGLLMISGGIDSPVAGFLMMKKGVKIEAIHFSSPPYTSDMAVYKVKTLLQSLAKIQGDIKLYTIPFTELQLKIYECCGDTYAITIMRRMMYRIAEIIAKKDRCLCIINGESVGQVASQTLESMQVINEVTNMVILRPLAVMDKNEIIRIAKEINTYATSILPYEDCCTIFNPKNPTTKPKHKECEFLESKFDFVSMIARCIENATIEYIHVSN